MLRRTCDFFRSHAVTITGAKCACGRTTADQPGRMSYRNRAQKTLIMAARQLRWAQAFLFAAVVFHTSSFSVNGRLRNIKNLTKTCLNTHIISPPFSAMQVKVNHGTIGTSEQQIWHKKLSDWTNFNRK